MRGIANSVLLQLTAPIPAAWHLLGTLAAGEDRMDRVGKAVGKDAAMSRYERDIRQALKVEFDAGCLREAGAARPRIVFRLLATIYPASGSKIDWTQSSGCNRMR